MVNILFQVKCVFARDLEPCSATLFDQTFVMIMVDLQIILKVLECSCAKNFRQRYTGPDLFGTGTKLVRISLVFTRDLVDPVRIVSAIWYQVGPLMKVILCGTVLFQFRTGPV